MDCYASKHIQHLKPIKIGVGWCMTLGSESQIHLEAVKATTIISTRTNTTIGTLNVRTMYETGKTTQVVAEMKRFNLTILGISESRWTGLVPARDD